MKHAAFPLNRILFVLLTILMIFSFVMPAAAAEATQAALSSYATITASLTENAAGDRLPDTVNNGQSVFLKLKMTQFKSAELVEYLKANSPVDLTMPIDFTGSIEGVYPTELNPKDFDNVAEYEGKPLFRWWIQDGSIRVRFDDDWVAAANANTVLEKAELGFSGTLNIQNKPEDGKIVFHAAGKDFPLQLKTGYKLEKKASAPMYRNGQYEVDYTVTFTLDQTMNITGNADQKYYSAALTLVDTLAASTSALTGDIIGTPSLTGPTTGLTASAKKDGMVNMFSIGGASVLAKGPYTLTYTMKVSSDAANAKLNGYNKANTVELKENGDSLKINGVTTPLTATATITWNNNISNRFKVDKCIVNQNGNSIVYRGGDEYYIDYYVVAYLRDEFTTFTVVDQIISNAVHTDKLPVTLLGANTAEGFWDKSAVSGLPSLSQVKASVIGPITGNDRSITITAEDGEILSPGAYYFKVPVNVTQQVKSLAAEANNEVGSNSVSDAIVEVKNKAILDEVDGDENINEVTRDVTGTINAPAAFIKRGAIETDSTGQYIIYDKEGVRGKLIRWDVYFSWSVPNTETVITDTMKGGQSLLANGSTSFDIWDVTGSAPVSIAQLWNKSDTDYIKFSKDENGNETFTFYPGRLSSNPQDSTRKFKLTYYTLVPEETVDFSPMTNSWTIKYQDSLPGTGVGPIGGFEKPQLGESVKLDLNKKWKYYVNDFVTQWLIEIKNPSKIPFDSLTKLIIVDKPTSQSGKGGDTFDGGEVWIDHDRMYSDLPLEIDVYAQNGKHERMILGTHYTIKKTHPDYDLGTDGRGGFAIEFNVPAVKELMKPHNAKHFASIGITCYVHNADMGTSNSKKWNITNNAWADYSVAGMELPDEDAVDYTNREYTTITKSIGSTVNNQHVIYHDYDGDGEKEVRWQVSTGANEFKTHPDPIAITITDTLPKELKLKDVAGDGWKTAFHVWATLDTSGNAVIDLSDPKYNASFSYDTDSNKFTLKFTKPGGDWAVKMGASGTWVSCNISVRYDTVFKDGEIQKALDKAGSTAVRVTMPLTNSASVSWSGNTNASPSASGDVVLKDVVLDKQAKWMASAGNKVAYTIDMNPYALSLSEDGTLRLQDVMGSGKESFVYLTDTFRLLNTATGAWLAPGDAASASTYAISFAEDGKSFALDVPDNTPLRLSYQVKTTKPVGTQDVSLVNNATLEGRSVNPVEIVFDVSSSYQSGSFTVEDDEAGIRILKIDSRDVDKASPTVLPGAEFTVTTLDPSGQPVGSPTVYTSDANGIITFVEKINVAKIVLVEETKAPANYKLDATPWKWCYVLMPAGMVISDAELAGLSAAVGCSVSVVNAGTYADEVVANEPFSVTIVKKNADGDILSGAEFTLTDSTGKTIAPDAVSFAGTHKFSGLVPGSYTLTETTAPTGYQLSEECSWTFTVGIDGSVSLPENAGYTLLSLDGGNLTVVNEPYTATGSVTFQGTKYIEGRNRTAADVFSFEIAEHDAAGNSIGTPWTFRNMPDGTISYPTIEYDLDDVGEHYYTVQETSENGSGITVDTTVHAVTVTVSDNGDGTLTAEVSDGPQSLDFTNTYSVTAQAQIQAIKWVNGKVDPSFAGKFSFSLETIETSDNVVENDTDGYVTFTTRVYDEDDFAKSNKVDKEGKRIITLSGRLVEEELGDGVNTKYDENIVYDKTMYMVFVTLTDQGDGTATSEVKYDKLTPQNTSGNESAATTTLQIFNNIIKTGSVTFAGSKILSGRALTADDTFTFEITEVDEGGKAIVDPDEEGNKIPRKWIATSGADGKINYPTFSYTLADVGKTYFYEVKETSTGGSGITTDTNTYMVTVTIADTQANVLDVQASAKVKAADPFGSDEPASVNALNFTNTYEATGSVTFSGTKKLEGRKLTSADIFAFTVSEDKEDGQTWTVYSDASGKIAYPTITYSLDDVGEHTYTVKEVKGEIGGITYDETSYTFSVTVTDNGDGTLKAEASRDVTALDFTNSYAATGSMTFAGSKTLRGRALTEDDVFSFTITEDLPEPEADRTWTATSNSEGKIVYPTIEYTLEDVGTHTYTVAETTANGNGITADKTTYTVTVTVSDNGDGSLAATATDNATALHFTNTYAATGSTQFSGKKTLTGKTLKENMFSFQLLDEDGNVLETVHNAEDGTFTFSALSYVLSADHSDLGDHTYTVKEFIPEEANRLDGVTYDETTYPVTVTVTDNGDGTLNAVPSRSVTTLNFTNTYGATGSVTFSGTKKLEGRELTSADIFEFTVSENKEDGQTWTVYNDASGAIAYPTITYSLNDVGEHAYTVKETSKDSSSITVDTNTYTVTVTVSDGGNGSLNVETSSNATALDFTNTYAASGSVTFAGNKTLSGRSLTEDDVFTFTITEDLPEPEADRTWTATSNSEGKIVYPTITYSLDDLGEHAYTVKEVKGALGGVTYDKTEYEISVTVSDNGDGSLNVEASGIADALDFTNTYEATGEITFSGTKTLEGRELTSADIFEFTVSEDKEDGQIWTVYSDASGKIAYPTITYSLDDLGEHAYTVKETKGEIGGVSYDETEYEITVTVSDNGDGTLKVEASDIADALNFTNAYAATGEITFSGTKTLTGRKLAENEFTFLLLDKDGNEIDSATNAADGSFSFDALTYVHNAEKSDLGEHSYTVKEVKDALGGMTYDETVYEITVTVTDNGDGTLKAEASRDVTALDFTNSYAATGEITFSGTKTLTGRELAADEFTFLLLDKDGNEIDSVTNAADGSFSFDALTYVHNAEKSDLGEHIYTVKELKGELGGVTYDDTAYEITVTVSDNGDGSLKVEASRDVTVLDFTNTYEASASLLLNAIKTVNGSEPADDQVYDFVCESAEGSLIAQNVNGNITFGTVYFSLEDVGKTFTYTIRETTSPTETLIVDEAVYTVTVTPSDNGNGTLALNPVIKKDGVAADGIIFDNQALASLTISKTVTGAQTGKAYDFTVTLLGADGSELTDAYAYTGDHSGEIVSGGVISLAHGQSVTIAGIPQGTTYRVEEEAGLNYTTMINGVEGSKAEGTLPDGGALLDFVNDVEETTFRVTKIWEGGQDSDIVLTLYADDVKLDPQPVYTREGSDYVYTGLPMTSETGEFIVYSAKEKGVEGYITIYNNIFPYADVTRRVHDGGTIINRPAKELSFKVLKVWNGLEPGETPPAITLTLYCNGVKTNIATPNPDSNGWYKYYNLPKLVDGKPAVYTVIEEPVTGFAAHYEDASGLKAEHGVNGGSIINTRIPKTGDDSSLALWIALMSASTAAMAMLILRRRKA